MFYVIRFILCLAGFVSCLAGVVFTIFVCKEFRPCGVWGVLFVVCSVIVLCLCAVLFVCLGMVKVVLV